ncbi:hypothetical protein GDO78_007379 [Eleutherodactylus coqui]|uniref:Uncharacterized protein n=1 Tax=Eleutherodactylus coqui TaxID=57060 RepID=A0A8J6KDB3_ELECQ|nr:hypothetical protein GDO78_007379 [Eleutherodactylus coqui]
MMLSTDCLNSEPGLRRVPQWRASSSGSALATGPALGIFPPLWHSCMYFPPSFCALPEPICKAAVQPVNLASTRTSWWRQDTLIPKLFLCLFHSF